VNVIVCLKNRIDLIQFYFDTINQLRSFRNNSSELMVCVLKKRTAMNTIYDILAQLDKKFFNLNKNFTDNLCSFSILN